MRTPVRAFAVLLAALVVLAYARVAGNGFTTFDDNEYLTQNPHVAEGLSAHGVAWAFTGAWAGNWHPLTWISHMLDVELFGMRAAGHHLVSLAIHLGTTLILFRLFLISTGAPLASLFVATVFGVHPLHVESVAWASERKDVLCAFFWVLALLAYVRYVERPGSARLAAVLGCHLLGLLSKPMIVSLPVTMLLLDFWPLRRFERARIAFLLKEKLPFLALSLVVSVVTFAVQRTSGAMELGIRTPFARRLASSVVAYAAYLGKMIWPARLEAYYPYPSDGYGAGIVLAAAALLALATAGALLAARSRPWLLFGWLWYLATLVPVIGLVQVGGQAMADRYTYVPMIGVSVAVAWTVREVAERVPLARMPVAGAFLLAAGAWTALTCRQVGYWKDDLALYEIAKVKVREEPAVLARIGARLLDEGRPEEAIEELRQAVAIDPRHAEAHNDLGRALEAVGRTVDATEEYRIAVRSKPELAEAHANLAGVLAGDGRLDEAIEHYARAVELRPDQADIRFSFAVALLARERTDEGIAELQRTLQLAPDHARAQRALRRALGDPGTKPP